MRDRFQRAHEPPCDCESTHPAPASAQPAPASQRLGAAAAARVTHIEPCDDPPCSRNAVGARSIRRARAREGANSLSSRASWTALFARTSASLLAARSRTHERCLHCVTPHGRPRAASVLPGAVTPEAASLACRRISNRESARRLRKQRNEKLHLLVAQQDGLQAENEALGASIVAQKALLQRLHAENASLRAQLGEDAQVRRAANADPRTVDSIAPPASLL